MEDECGVYHERIVVYALCEPDSYTVRYVGASGNIVWRIKCHWDGTQTSTAGWVKSLAKEGKKPHVMILEITTSDHGYEAEKRWMKHFRQIGNLLNRSTAGYHTRIRETQKLRDAAFDVRLNLRELAEKVGCQPGLLTRACKGTSPIDMEVAVRIQEATKSRENPNGYEATEANWPKLRLPAANHNAQRNLSLDVASGDF